MRLATLLSALLLTSALHAETPVTPRKAPEFVLQFTDGSQKLLSSFRGKAVCLEFIYTTCQHCQHASQVMSKMNTEFAGKSFQPLAVAWDPMSKMRVPDFIKQFGVNYPVGYAERDPVLSFLGFSPMERVVVPQIVWIDKKGMIRAQTNASSGGDESMRQEPFWREMALKLTAEGDSSAKKTVAAAKKSGK